MYGKKYRPKGARRDYVFSIDGYVIDDNLFTWFEAAQYCGLTYYDWWALVKQKHVPPCVWIKKKPYWRRDVLEAWFAANMPPANEWKYEK